MNDWTLVHLKNLVFHEAAAAASTLAGHDFISKNWKSAWIWNKAANKQQAAAHTRPESKILYTIYIRVL